jgi:ribosome-binding factor A
LLNVAEVVMTSYRADQVGEQVREEIMSIIRRDLKDPRIGFVSITAVRMSPDLRQARVRVSVLGNPDEQKASINGLISAKGLIRHELGRRLENLKFSPELRFELDPSIEYSVHISELLKEVLPQGGSPATRALPASGGRGESPLDNVENGENELPRLEQGEDLDYHGLKPEQHFTQPPPRYTEATLIKELEQRGIGRPSTYAPTVQTITRSHGYVEIKDRRLYPTRVGEAVNSLMVDHFKTIADDEYTSKLEKRLDEVESGHQEWVPVVKDFYGPLQRMLSAAEEATPADTDEVCPLCHEGHLVRKASRFGPFMGCSRYPKCKFRRALNADGEAQQPKLLDEPCPNCGRPLQLRNGRYGEFVGCSGYPECKYIKRDAAQAPSKLTGEKCPQCGEGDLVERTGRYGPFVACSRYPDCNYRANMGKDGKPRQGPKVLDEPCPICGKPLVERRGRYGPFKSCSDYPKCPGPKGVKKAAVA